MNEDAELETIEINIDYLELLDDLIDLYDNLCETGSMHEGDTIKTTISLLCDIFQLDKNTYI